MKQRQYGGETCGAVSFLAICSENSAASFVYFTKTKHRLNMFLKNCLSLFVTVKSVPADQQVSIGKISANFFSERGKV